MDEETRQVLNDLTERLEQLEQENQQLREKNQQLRSELDELRDDMEYGFQHAGRERAKLSGRVSDVEELKQQIDAGEIGQEPVEEPTDDSPAVEPQTYLETVVGMDETAADQTLTENQQRARFVASDVMDYSDHAPGGDRVLTPGRIGKVVKAGLDIKPHTETITRIVGFLEEMGEETVSVVKRRGERRVKIDEQAARRLDALGATETDRGNHESVRRGEA